MNDEQWKAHIRTITDPRELLREVAAHFSTVPCDPYYRDLTDVILDRAAELSA